MLKPYMGYAGEPEYGAVLIFADNAKTAKKLAFDNIKGWINGWTWNDCCWIDVRIRWLKENAEYFLKEYAKEIEFYKGRSFVIDDPIICKQCENWGSPIINGLCANCREENEN